MKITYQAESGSSITAELGPLFPLHWREIGLDQESIPLDPDMERYAREEAAGNLHVATARADGELVGYYVNCIRPHPHYRSTLCAFSDIYYVVPKFRRGPVGIELFRFMEAEMRHLGVRRIHTMSKIHKSIAPMLERLGYRAVETVYTKVLE